MCHQSFMSIQFAIYNCICEFMLDAYDGNDVVYTRFLNKWEFTYDEMIDNYKIFAETLENIKNKGFKSKDCFDILIADLLIVRGVSEEESRSMAHNCLSEYDVHLTDDQVDTLIRSHAGKNREVARIIGKSVLDKY